MLRWFFSAQCAATPAGLFFSAHWFETAKSSFWSKLARLRDVEIARTIPPTARLTAAQLAALRKGALQFPHATRLVVRAIYFHLAGLGRPK